MNEKSVRTEEDIEQAFDTYADMIYSYSLIMLKNKSDAEDVVQDTFVKYMKHDSRFESEEHKKAWLLRVSSNLCCDMLRYSVRHRTESVDEITENFEGTDVISEDSGIIEALYSVPEKYRSTLILHYVHEYKVREIAGILKITQSAVKMRLKKGRELLENIYRKEFLS